jgi:hypothetical protein
VVAPKVTVSGSPSASTDAITVGYAASLARAPAFRRPSMWGLFLDTWDFFAGVASNAPNGTGYNAGDVRPGWTNNQGQLTITGTVGASTLTLTSIDIGVLADYDPTNGRTCGSACVGPWGAVIQHDDGTYGVYSVTAISSSTVTIQPTLQKSATGKHLWNLYNEQMGQHLGPQGYAALAWWVSQQTKRYSYIELTAGGNTYSDTGALQGTAWTALGGLTGTPYYVPGTTSLIQGVQQGYKRNLANAWDATPQLPDATFQYGGSVYETHFGAGTAGQGVGLSADLDGRSGYFTTMVSVDGQDGSTAPSAALIKVWIDGTLVYNQTVVKLTRVKVPFNLAKTARVEITLSSSIPTDVRVTRTGWFVWNDPDLPMIDDPVIPAGSRLCAVMDSWGAYYTGAFPTALQTATGAAYLDNVSVAGTTMQWAVSTFASSLATQSCDYVVVDQQINDYATFTANQWRAQVEAFVAEALAAGVTPIFLRSLNTQVYGQTQTLSVYDDNLMYNHPTAITRTLSQSAPRIYTSSTVPAAAASNNGMLVQLSDTGQLAYSNGVTWTPVLTTVPAANVFDKTSISLEEDWMTGMASPNYPGSLGQLGWNLHQVGGSSANFAASSASTPPGGLPTMTTEAVQGQGLVVSLDPGGVSSFGQVGAQAHWKLEMYGALSSTANIRLRTGLINPNQTWVVPTAGIWLRADTNAPAACTVTTAVRASGLLTVTCNAAHGLLFAETETLSGITYAGSTAMNGSCQIVSSNLSTSSFTCLQPGEDGSGSGGTATPSGDSTYKLETCNTVLSIQYCTVTDTGVALDTSRHDFWAWTTTAGTVNLQLDTGTVYQVTTNLPGTAVVPGMALATDTTTAKSYYPRFNAFQQTGISGR